MEKTISHCAYIALRDFTTDAGSACNQKLFSLKDT